MPAHRTQRQRMAAAVVVDMPVAAAADMPAVVDTGNWQLLRPAAIPESRRRSFPAPPLCI
jgi:hypothetical protein